MSGLQAVNLLKNELFTSGFQGNSLTFPQYLFQGTSFSGCFPVNQEIEQEIITGYMKIHGMKIVVNLSSFILIFFVVGIYIQSYKDLSLFIYCCVVVE